jgi:PKD repeat protein
MRIIFISIILFTLPISQFVYGQIYNPGKPRSFIQLEKLSTSISKITLSSPDTSQLNKWNREFPSPTRYGICRKIDFELRDEARAIPVSDGNIWQLKIQSEGAVSIGIFLSEFYVPPGAELYLFNDDRSRIYGSFTSWNNNSDSTLALADFKGDHVIIEYYEPNEAAFKGSLKIDRIVHAYKNIFKYERQKAASSNVSPGINCPEGDNWQDAKRAVCRITFNDGINAYLCSGALINNTQSDGTPYFLTAAHCLSTTGIANTVVAWFNYEEEYCNGTETTPKTLSGAEVAATYDSSDFTLLRFGTEPPNTYYPYYAGWNAYDSIMQSGACIHHPDGQPKKISLTEHPIVSYPLPINWDVGINSPSNSHWQVSWDVGSTMGGSSGSPLFDSNKRIMGQLHGGTDDNVDFFGKLFYSWNGPSSDSSHQLRHWLDPANTGVRSFTAYVPPTPPIADFKTLLNKVCTQEPVQLYDASLFDPTEWTWTITPQESVEFVNGTNEDSQNPEVIFRSDGQYSINLIASNDYGFDSKYKPDFIVSDSKIDASIIGFNSDTFLCGSDINNLAIKAVGAISYEFNFLNNADHFEIEKGTDEILISLKPEFMQNGSFSTELNLVASYGRCSDTINRKIDVFIPLNDDIQNALELKDGSNGIFNNYCATIQPGEPFPSPTGCNANDGWCNESFYVSGPISNTLWYKFTGSGTGIVSVEVPGFDDQMAIYQSDSYDDLLRGLYKLVAANDNKDYQSKDAMLHKVEVEPGKQYWLQVDGSHGGEKGVCEVEFYSYGVEVFPNPSNGQFTINVNWPRERDIYIELFSLQGTKIYASTIKQPDTIVKLPITLPDDLKGLYLLYIHIDDKVYSKKIFIL